MVSRLRSGEVRRVSSCRLHVGRRSWGYAERHRAEALAEFERQRAANAGYFNGEIQIMVDHQVADGCFIGEFARSDFASFIYWRANGHPDDTVRDCFGCAVVRASDGAVLLGVQSAGNLNAGRAYFPSGFIDAADVRSDGSIDIDGSIVREITEETGIAVAALTRQPGYVLVATDASIAVAVEYRSPLTSQQLRSAALRHLAREAAPELSDVLLVRAVSDLEDRQTTPHVLPLLAALLPPERQ